MFDCCTGEGIVIDAMESDKDHLHILVDIPPTISAFSIIHRIKQITTFRIYKIMNEKTMEMPVSTAIEGNVAVIKSKFNEELVRNGYAALVKKASELVFDEQGKPEVEEYLKGCRSLVTKLEAVKKVGKAPVLKAGDEWESAFKEFKGMIVELYDPVYAKLVTLNKSIEAENAKKEAERKRIEQIKNAIVSKMTYFSTSILSCNTATELTNVQKLINLEKTKKGFYAEFFDTANTEFGKLNDMVQSQKEKIKAIEELEKKASEAIKSGDEDLAAELQEKVELKNVALQENVEHNIQEISNAAIAVSVNMPVVGEITKVSARRTSWDMEIVDFKKLAKEKTDWIVQELDKPKVKEYLSAKLKDGSVKKEDNEFTVFGVRFYKKVLY